MTGLAGGAVWSTGLIKTLNDTANHIISSDCAVVVADKYPKAQHHYLVLPTANIASIFDLRTSHLPLLEELHLLALNIIELKGGHMEQYKIGFHAQPSMQQLHLHVISQDFVSDCLKTKKHWHSFNTEFFLPYQDAYAALQAHGCIERLSKERLQALSNTPLQCNQCTFVAKRVPELKQHLLQHWLDAKKS